MTGNIEEKGAADGSRDHTEDGTVDIKGNPALRSKSGRWKACSFMLGYEVFERMAYYGIVSNLVLYLTRKLHEGTVTSSNNVTNWAGTVWILPVFGAYIADAHLGRFRTFVIASGIYLVGMSLLTLAVSVPSLRPPSCGHGIKEEGCDKPASALQKGIFYGALYIIAVGTGGTKPNISTMGADQFDDFEPKEKQQKLSFFNWWNQAQHLYHGSRSVRRLRTQGKAAEALILQLVDVQYFLWHPFLKHIPGLHTRQRRLDPWLWHSYLGARTFYHHILDRQSIL